MLVLSRKTGDSIQIDGGIRITVLGLEGNRVRLGIEAPREVAIMRSELLLDLEPDESLLDENRVRGE